jgi:hypothetical protein
MKGNIMISSSQIKPEAPVVCSNNARLGVVDHMDGKDRIKLKKDSRGLHHFIPMDWVTSVDDKVHISLADEQAMTQWTSDSMETAGSERSKKTMGVDSVQKSKASNRVSNHEKPKKKM